MALETKPWTKLWIKPWRLRCLQTESMVDLNPWWTQIRGEHESVVDPMVDPNPWT